MRLQSFDELYKKSAEAKRRLLETDLLLVSVSIDITRRRYQRGNGRDGDQSKAHAQKAIYTVRHFTQTADYLDPAERALLASKCDELEGAVAALCRRRATKLP